MRQDRALCHEAGGHVLRDHQARLRTGLGDQERRERVRIATATVHQTVDAALGKRGELLHSNREHVERQGQRLAVEVAAAQHIAAVDEEQRIVGNRTKLGLDRAVHVGESLTDGTEHLRDAAQCVGVLHPLAVNVALAHLRPVDELEQSRRNGLLLGPITQRVQPGIKRGRRAEERVDTHRGSNLRGGVQALRFRQCERANRRHQMGAVEECQALLGTKLDRLHPDETQRRRAVDALARRREGLTLTNQDERKVRQRGEIATGAYRAARRHDRRDIRIEQFDERLHDLDAHARVSARQRGGKEQEHAAHNVDGQRLPNADRVATNDVDLQLRKLAVGDAHRLERAETGSHAVDGLALTRHTRDQLGRGSDTGAGALTECDRRLAIGHRDDVGARQCDAVKRDHRPTHAGIIAHSRQPVRRRRRSAAAHRREHRASPRHSPRHRSA